MSTLEQLGFARTVAWRYQLPRQEHGVLFSHYDMHRRERCAELGDVDRESVYAMRTEQPG